MHFFDAKKPVLFGKFSGPFALKRVGLVLLSIKVGGAQLDKVY